MEYYSEYLNRGAGGRFQRIVTGWHRRVWRTFLREANVGLSRGALNIFEVGYGHGIFADLVTSEGHEYSGADISRPLVDLASANGHDVRLVTDLHPSELAEQFDVVWLSHVLEHCDGWKEARDLVAFYSRFLRPDGLLVIVGPDLLSWKEQFWSADFSHGFGTSRRNVCQLLSDVGLAVAVSSYHRGGSVNPLVRAVFRFLAVIPHVPLDWLSDRERSLRGEGIVSSMKVVLAWRQLLIAASPSGELSGSPSDSVRLR